MGDHAAVAEREGAAALFAGDLGDELDAGDGEVVADAGASSRPSSLSGPPPSATPTARAKKTATRETMWWR